MTNSQIRILFICNKDDKFSVLAIKFLKEQGFNINIIWSTNVRNENLLYKIGKWKGHFIIHFASYYILQKKILKKASQACINFHPSTPKYPGAGGASWALYNGDNDHGVTCHFMDEKIDHGKIIDVKYFKINNNENIDSLIFRTKKMQFIQFKKIIRIIKKDMLVSINKLSYISKKIRWSNKTYKTRDLDKLQTIKMRLTSKEISNIDRIVRSTFINNYKPKILMGKHQFVLIENKKQMIKLKKKILK